MSQLLDVLLDDTQRLLERRAKPAPPAPMLMYDTVSCDDIPEAIVGYTYTPGEDAQTWGPPENCHEGSPEELEISEVWINGVELSAVLRDSVLEQIEEATLERAHQRQDKGREWDGE